MCIGVLPLSSVGKNHIPITAKAYQQPLIRAHSQAVADICFDPFDRHRLFSCSGDALVKLWRVPEQGYVQDENTPVISVSTSRGVPLKGIVAHPSASGLFAVRGNKDVFLMDLEAGREIGTSAANAFSADISFASWSFSGHVLTVTAKDKLLKLLDFRSNRDLCVSSVAAHGGTRPSRAAWLGDSPYLATTGHNAAIEREVCWSIDILDIFINLMYLMYKIFIY